jgi:hypothetical protein
VRETAEAGHPSPGRDNIALIAGPTIRRSALAAVVVIAALGTACGGPIRADELSRSVDTLISSAGEGELLAQGVADDRTKTTFVRAHARELGEVVDHETEKLSDASAKPDLSEEKRAAVGLAEHISSALGDLQTSPTDEKTAAQVAQQLSRLASRCERLRESL